MIARELEQPRPPNEADARPPVAFFPTFSRWLARSLGSAWAFLIATLMIVLSLIFLGVETTSIALSTSTLLVVLVLQNTENRESSALHLKLDEIITHLHGPRNHIAGAEARTHEEIEELRGDVPSSSSSHALPEVGSGQDEDSSEPDAGISSVTTHGKGTHVDPRG